MPTLPPQFKPVVAGYSHDAPGGVTRVDVAGGAPRYGVEWDRGTQQFSVTLILDKQQYSVWVAFWQYAIQKGALAFDMPLDSGFGVAPHTVNIVPGSYSLEHTGGTLVTVRFTVEALSGAYSLTDADVAAFAATNGLTAASLPTGFQPVLSGYGHNGAEGATRGEVGGGVASYALEYEGGLQQFTCTLILNEQQYRVWSIWYCRLLGKGVKSFQMPLDSGFGLTPHLVNIVPGSCSVVRNGMLSVVSFTVEGESQVLELGEEGGLALVEMAFLYGSGISLLLQAIEKFANVDSLVLQF